MKSKILSFLLVCGFILGAFGIARASYNHIDVTVTGYHVPLISPIPCAISYVEVGGTEVLKAAPPALTDEAISDIGGDSTNELCASLRTAFSSGSAITIAITEEGKILGTSLKAD